MHSFVQSYLVYYRNALKTTPWANLVHELDLKYLYDYNSS